MDREQVRQWREGFRAFEEFHIQELRGASDEDRWRWLNAAIGIVQLVGAQPTPDQREADADVVRRRWALLKRGYS